MIIVDVNGKIISNPNLQKGKLDESFIVDEKGQEQKVYIYFPFNEEEQEDYNYLNKTNITQDKCECVIYESTKASITYSDTDPFCYAYAREVDRGNKTIAQCPSELQERIKELAHPDATVTFDTSHVTFSETEGGSKLTSLKKAKGYAQSVYVKADDTYTIVSIDDDKEKHYTLTDGRINISFDQDKHIYVSLEHPEAKKAKKTKKKKKE